MLPVDVAACVESHIGEPVIRHEVVSGGCIANASRIETHSGSYFLKWSRDEVAKTFPPEATGLKALREAGTELYIPEPIAASDVEGTKPGILLLEWIEPGRRGSAFWVDFGRHLAALHRHSHDRYGFEADNFIGRLPQANTWEDSWPDFFMMQRIQPQVRMARDRGRWKSGWDDSLERLANALDSILPRRPEPSILHGDLWGGNYMVTGDGRAALVDPAAYYGHRETDIGMTRLFGGFDQRFYDAYLEAWPVEPGFEERLEIYNLYHLINHLNHFGSGYTGAVDRILRRF